MKKAHFLLEIILVIVLMGFLYSIFIPKAKNNKLEELTQRVSLYLSYLRYKAMIDDKYNENNSLWYKQRWTMKFFRCKQSVGGVYFTIYSEENVTGHPNQKETLKDPLTNKYIYNNNSCSDNNENSKYTLLSKYYDVESVQISCNSTDSLGQISFGSDGKIYSRISDAELYEITKPCTIRFISKNKEYKDIKIHAKTGFIE